MKAQRRDIPDADSFQAYLAKFHAERAGITERILARCRSDSGDPYTWAAVPIGPGDGPVVDIACGSGPMRDHVQGWIGLDISRAELVQASTRGRGPVVLGSGAALPVGTASARAVVSTMALQVVNDLPAVLAEIARVLRPAGTVSVLLPATGPLPRRHLVTYARLQITLRRSISYPNDPALAPRRFEELSAQSGLTVTRDERRTFMLAIDTPDQGDEFLSSLYLPGVSRRRLRRARTVLGRHVGDELAVPMRRIILTNDP